MFARTNLIYEIFSVYMFQYSFVSWLRRADNRKSERARIHSGCLDSMWLKILNFNSTDLVESNRIELKVNESMIQKQKRSQFVSFLIVCSLHVIDVWSCLLRPSVDFVPQMYVCRLISKYFFYIDSSRCWRPRLYVANDRIHHKRNETKAKYWLIWFGKFSSVKANWSNVFFKSAITQITFRSSKLLSGQYVRACMRVYMRVCAYFTEIKLTTQINSSGIYRHRCRRRQRARSFGNILPFCTAHWTPYTFFFLNWCMVFHVWFIWNDDKVYACIQ